MARVEVRPLENTKWHGKKDKENFSRPKAVEVLYDENQGGYATGLTSEEQKKYESLMGVDLSPRFNPESPHPYWSSKAALIILPNHTVFFDTNKHSEFIKVKNMKASKLVANSLTEWNEGKWPFATHVIYDEQEEIEVKASKIKTRQEALLKVAKLGGDAKRSLIQIVRNKNLKNHSDDFVDVEMADICDNQEDVLDLLKAIGMGRDEVQLRATILECIDKAILRKEGTGVYYLGDQIGYDYEDAVKWFKEPENQRMKVMIFEKLNK